MDLEKDLRDLAERTAQIRHQFLRVELDTCFIALEMAEFEPANGNTAFAKREICRHHEGHHGDERFLAELRGAEKSAVEEKLADLKTAFKPPAQKVNAGSA